MLTILVRMKILTDALASVASVWIRAWVTSGKPTALTAATFFDWEGGGGLANAEGVSLLGLGDLGNFEI